MELTIAWIGKTRSASIHALTEEYLKRLRHYANAQGVSLKDERALRVLSGRDRRAGRRRLVLVDARGTELTSAELGSFIGEHRQRHPLPLVFAVGPADGFTDQTRAQADFMLSLGRMTIAHELARVLLLEQIYRAFTILERHPYHLGH